MSELKFEKEGVYESKTHGTVVYKGTDEYFGERILMFDSIDDGGRHYWKPSALHRHFDEPEQTNADLQRQLDEQKAIVKDLNLEIGIKQIAFEHQSVLLESCEKALDKRDQSLGEQKAMVNNLLETIETIVNSSNCDPNKYTGSEGKWVTVNLRSEYFLAATKDLENTPQQSLDTLKAEIEEEAIDRCADLMLPKSGRAAQRIKDMPRKYQLPANENKIGSKVQNPSCFKKKLGVEACNHGCPVSGECYK